MFSVRAASAEGGSTFSVREEGAVGGSTFSVRAASAVGGSEGQELRIHCIRALPRGA
jgi:hypothetical protein